MSKKDDVNKVRPFKEVDPYLKANTRYARRTSSVTAASLEASRQMEALEEQRTINQEQIESLRENTTGAPKETAGRLSAAIHREERLANQWARQSNIYETSIDKNKLTSQKRFESEVRSIAESGVGLSGRTHLEQARNRAYAATKINRGEYTESSINRNIDRLPITIKRRTDSLLEETRKSLDDENQFENYHIKSSNLEKSKTKLARNIAADKELKSLGLDSNSVLQSSLEKKKGIEGLIGNQNIANQVASGRTDSLSQEQSKLTDFQDKFLDAQSKFTEALSNGTENIDDFKQSVLGSSKALDEQTKLVKEMVRQGAGGGNNTKLAGSALSTVGGAIGSLSNLYTNATVTSEHQQLGLRAGFARIQNQTFFDHLNAAQGNMSSLNMVNSGIYNRATKLGIEQGNQAEIGVKGSAVGNFFSGAGDLVKSMTGGASAGSAGGPRAAIVGGALAAGGSVVNSVEKIGTRAIDLDKQISKGGASLQGYGDRYDLQSATDEVKSFAMQKFFDSSLGNYKATQGFGQNRSAVVNDLQKSHYEMAQLGLTTQDTQGLYSQAIGSMGSNFTNKGVDGMRGLVSRAAEVGNSGVTSSQDFLSRVGQMNNAGGGEKQIEDIMANAVARGVDNAKSFGQMVDAVVSASSASANNGIDITGTMTRNIAKSMDASKDNGVNDELNINVAKKNAKIIDSITGDKGLSFASIMEQGKLSKMGGSIAARVNAQEVTLAEAQEIQQNIKEGRIQEAKVKADRAGISELLFNKDGKPIEDKVNKFVNIKKETIADSLKGITDVETANRIANSGGKGLSDEDKSTLFAGTGLTTEGLAQTTDKSFTKKGINSLTGDAKSVFETEKAKATADSKTINAGGEISGGLGQIASQMSSIASSLKPLDDIGRAMKGATEMRLDVSAFNTSVTSFATAVEMLRRALGDKVENQNTTFIKNIPPVLDPKPAAKTSRGVGH